MRFLSGGHLHWYDLPFLALAFPVVYPDETLEWLAEKTGQVIQWWHFAVVEALAIGLILATYFLLVPFCPRLNWWTPCGCVVAWAVVRLARRFITRFFGFED